MCKMDRFVPYRSNMNAEGSFMNGSVQKKHEELTGYKSSQAVGGVLGNAVREWQKQANIHQKPREKNVGTHQNVESGASSGISSAEEVQKTYGIGEKNAPDLVKNFVRIAKVGIAVAIIKSAPAGINGEEYARRLCSQYQHAQLRYKERTSQLQREVLLLRQQLLQTQIKQLEARGSAGQPATSNTPQCDESSTGNVSDVEEEKAPDIFPTPPCSSSEGEKKHSMEARLSQYTSFLRSFSHLRMLTTSPLSVDKDHWKTVAKTTVLQTLPMLKESITEPAGLTLSPTLQTNTVKTLVKLMKDGACQSYWSEAAEAIGHLINSTLLNILHCKALNQHKRHEHLRKLIVEFVHVINLRPAILKLLIHYVTEYSQHLRQVKSRQAEFTPWTHENMYHVIWCLEHVIKREEVETSGLLVGEEGDRIKDQLEDSLLHVSETFPLFSMYVWHIEGLLDNVKTNNK